jgi:hypothetical protein
VQSAIIFAGTLHSLCDGGKVGELIVGDEEVDAGDVHLHDAPGAEIEMADFAVAHLTVR